MGISHLKRATEGALDAGTSQFVQQISADTEAFEAQITEENFPVCAARCAAAGLQFSWFIAGEQGPMIPQLLGREPARRQGAWGRLEGYVPEEARFHSSGNAQAAGGGDSSGPG